MYILLLAKHCKKMQHRHPPSVNGLLREVKQIRERVITQRHCVEVCLGGLELIIEAHRNTGFCQPWRCTRGTVFWQATGTCETKCLQETAAGCVIDWQPPASYLYTSIPLQVPSWQLIKKLVWAHIAWHTSKRPSHFYSQRWRKLNFLITVAQLKWLKSHIMFCKIRLWHEDLQKCIDSGVSSFNGTKKAGRKWHSRDILK